MKTTRFAILLTTLLLASTSYAHDHAERHGHSHGRMHGHDGHMSQRHLEHMAKAADATPEQKAQITAIAKAAEADIKPLRDQMRANRERGQALYTAPTIDRAAMEQHHALQFKIMEQISRREMQARMDSAEVLSAEQRAKLVAKMKKHHERRGHGSQPQAQPAK